MRYLNITLIFIVGLFSCANSQNSIVEMQTSFGTIEIEIFEQEAPITANHFLQNVTNSVFTEACFYRVVRMDNQPHNDIKIEVIQGGLFHDSIVDQLPTIIHETTDQTGIYHANGVISMARNQPGSASTEFFICVGDQPNLDYGGMRNPDGQGFAAFGKVIKGMNVVKEIQNQKDSGQMLSDRIKITSVKIKMQL